MRETNESKRIRQRCQGLVAGLRRAASGLRTHLERLQASSPAKHPAKSHPNPPRELPQGDVIVRVQILDAGEEP